MTYSVIHQGPSPADNFTIIANAALRDERLSYKARGLLACLRTYRDGWQSGIEKLAHLSTDGKDSVRSGIRELEVYGYLIRVPERDATGRMLGWRYEISDTPRSQPVADFPPTGYPTMGKSNGGTAENPPRGTAENPPTKEELLTEDQEEDCDELTLIAPPPGPTPNQVIDWFAKLYHSRHPDENFHGVRTIIAKALKVYRPGEIERALIAHETHDGGVLVYWKFKRILEDSPERRDARLFDENGMFRDA